MFDSRIDSVFSEQLSAKLDDSIFNPLNKTVDSQESFDKQKSVVMRSKAFAEKAIEMKKYQAWKQVRDAKIAERAKKKAEWEKKQKVKEQSRIFKKTGIKVNLSEIKLKPK